VGPRAGLTGAEILAPHWDSTPGPFSPYRVTIPTELSRPALCRQIRLLFSQQSNFTFACDIYWYKSR